MATKNSINSTLASPFTIGSTSVTTTGTQLNLLNAATGTTGTASTNLVFSTNAVLTTPTITTKLNPTSDDGAPLGDTTHNWSDLFLASGAVLNYSNSDVLLTHTSGTLTLGTGTLKITTPTNTSTSVVTIDGTQTLTNKTLTSPNVNEAVALTSTSTKLNYLTSAGGTTGTNSTNIVFSTSPAFTTSVTGDATFAAFNTTTTNLSLGGAATTLTVGGTPTTAVTHNYSTNATAASTTKTINFGTGGAALSTTLINMGSSTSGTQISIGKCSSINDVVCIGGNGLRALTGTVACNASTSVVGTSTLFTTELKVGDAIKIGTEWHEVTVVTDATHITITPTHIANDSGVTSYTDNDLLHVHRSYEQRPISGTVTVTINTTSVSGSGTNFLNELKIGDIITIGASSIAIASIASATALTLVSNHPAGASAVTAYTISPKMRLTRTGHLLVGGITDRTNLYSTYDSQYNSVLEIGGSIATATADHFGTLVLSTIQSGTAHTVGAIQFANSVSSASDKRLGSITVTTDGATTAGFMAFSVASASVMSEVMRITSNKTIGINKTASIGAMIDIVASTTSNRGLRIASFSSSQTANLLQVDNTSNSITLFSVGPKGGLSITQDAQTVTTETVSSTFNSGLLTVSTGYAEQRYYRFIAPIISINNSQTVTTAHTVFIDGAPYNSGQGTLTNTFALFVNSGVSRFNGPLEIGSELRFIGDIFNLEMDSTITTGNAKLTFNDNLADAFSFVSSDALNYLTFVSTNSSEEVNVKQRLATKTGDAFVTKGYVGGTLTVNTTGVGNIGAGEDDLITYSNPAGILAKDGDYLEFEMGGTTAANGNNKTIKIKYGATTIIDTGAVAANNETWTAKVIVIRTGAATQKIIADFSGGTLLTKISKYTTATETLSGAVTFKCTGEATTTDDIKQELLIAKWGNKG